MHSALVEKLHPNRIRCSGSFTALLAFILEEHWTEPEIAWAAITSDGFLVTDAEFFGGQDDLTRNLQGVAAAAGLNTTETEELLQQAARRIEGYRPRPAAARFAPGSR